MRLACLVGRALVCDQCLEQGDAFGAAAVLIDPKRVAEPRCAIDLLGPRRHSPAASCSRLPFLRSAVPHRLLQVGSSSEADFSASRALRRNSRVARHERPPQLRQSGCQPVLRVAAQAPAPCPRDRPPGPPGRAQRAGAVDVSAAESAPRQPVRLTDRLASLQRTK
jgi:hypothetical protein